MTDLNGIRFSARTDLRPLYGAATAAQPIVGGVDTTGQASRSSDIERDWAVYITRHCSESAVAAVRINARVTWTAGGLIRQTELPLRPLVASELPPLVQSQGIVLHVTGIDVKVEYVVAAGQGTTIAPTTDNAIASVAPGQPAISWCVDAMVAINVSGAPDSMSCLFFVPRYAVEVMANVVRDDGVVALFPPPPVILKWELQGVTGAALPVFDGVLPSPSPWFPVPGTGSARFFVIMPGVPNNSAVFATVQWRLSL